MYNSKLIFFLISFLSIFTKCLSHFQPNIQQVYQQQNQYQQPNQFQAQNQYQQPNQAQNQQHVPIQNQYQYQQPSQPNQGHQAATNNILHDKTRIHDKHHLQEHLGNVLNEPDINKMSEEELQFHYFKIHDADNNNKLDGSELIKSLIHWHVEESKHLGDNAPPQGTTKIFNDEELSQMIDPILETDDKNKDGFIDYAEFVMAQKSRGF